VNDLKPPRRTFSIWGAKKSKYPTEASVTSNLHDTENSSLWRGCVDEYWNGVVTGWAAKAHDYLAPVELELLVFGEVVARTFTQEKRPDVSNILGFEVQVGFRFDITNVTEQAAARLHEVLAEAGSLRIKACDVIEVRLVEAQVPLPMSEAFMKLPFDPEYLLRNKGPIFYRSYLAQNADSLVSLIRLLGRDSSVIDGNLLRSFIIPMFSARWYREQNNLAETTTDIECFLRYLATDFGNGKPPGPFFDGNFYTQQAVKKGLEPPQDPENSYLHWLHFGVKNRINPMRWFDEASYVELNPDLNSNPEIPYLHFLRHGIEEGRQFNTLMQFSKLYYPHSASSNARDFFDEIAQKSGAQDEISAGLSFWRSQEMAEICKLATAIDPEVQFIKEGGLSLIAPWHDVNYELFKLLRSQVEGTWDNIVLMPFCKLGGADFVASVLATSIAELGTTIVLRTDQSDWSRPDWFPPEVKSVDLSPFFAAADPNLRKRLLYEVVRSLRPKNVFNVNSRLAFETFETYGARLQRLTNLHSYYFCADRTPDGHEAGYPVTYFANILPYMSSALIDTQQLATTLAERYCLPDDLRSKIAVMYTPAVSEIAEQPLAVPQVASQQGRKSPVLLWAGRFDRQKRFDLLMRIAAEMPDVTFKCWGAAVLDPMPSLDAQPDNLVINPPFKSYDELPLEDCDGLVYTSAWDGLPTILIEFGALGMPIVASAVGGVPELIDDTTGWPVSETAEVADYVTAIRAMLSRPDERVQKATRLMQRVKERHSREFYLDSLRTLIERKSNNV
jgi:glycosyltransferase involved in cell wall biosynthesis